MCKMGGAVLYDGRCSAVRQEGSVVSWRGIVVRLEGSVMRWAG